MEDIKSNKKKIRKEIKNLFKTLSPEDFNTKSEQVLANLTELDVWKNAETILIFLSLPDEISTALIIDKALHEGKKAAVPRIKNNDLVFHLISSLDSDFITHPLGMDEPRENTPVIIPDSLSPDKTLILVPGLAFDKNCFRLGRGKGFYDRFLSSVDKSIIKAGIGYDFQLIASVPVEEHDFSLDMIVTDKSVY